MSGSTPQGFLKSGHLPTLVSALLYFDVSFMVWVMLGALGTFIADDLDLSPAQTGMMTAVPLLAGSCFRIILGALADRIGGRRTGICALAVTTVPLLFGYLAADTISPCSVALSLNVSARNGASGPRRTQTMKLTSK